MNRKIPGVGVIVGRFQVPHLHEGHIRIIEKANRHQKLLVLLGNSPLLLSPRDPMDQLTRERLIRESYPHAAIHGIWDSHTNEAWSRQLDNIVHSLFTLHAENREVTLYSGRDGFARCYRGVHQVQIFDDPVDVSGTLLRKELGSQIRESEDFRVGVIYASQNQRPRINPTVDLAVVREQFLLLGKKNKYGDRMVLPGGFVDFDDASFETAARRELLEETGLTCEGELKYLGSFEVSDWRMRCGSQKIMTTLYQPESPMGMAKAGDDLDAVEWVPLNQAVSRVVDWHKPLVERIVEVNNG